jgi:chemotaxis protein MotB
MASEEKKTIVIKKIYDAGHGGHGGGWKVAFADFMTAMMCFFLVMWLLNQSEETKKQVASYFSGPSMIEHQFTSYGAELTLEKLFLDLVNQPMKTIQEFMQPADFTPNLMAMGSKKVVLHYIAEQLGQMAANVDITADSVVFEVPDKYFFERGSNKPSSLFIPTMKKIESVTQGLEHSVVKISSSFFYTEGTLTEVEAEWVSKSRVDIIQNKVAASMEHASNEIIVNSRATKNTFSQTSGRQGFIKFEITQKESLPNGRKPRKLEAVFDKDVKGEDLYQTFVNKASKSKSQNKKY